MAKHALLSASKADQWINCPPSAKVQENLPDKQSKEAAEGTLAHSIAEAILRIELGEDTVAPIFKKYANDPLFYEGMVSEVQVYIDYVMEAYNGALAKTEDAIILLEEKLDYAEWAPEGSGTGDCVIIADSTLEIIDLKFGKGVPVSAINNSQTRLYGLGAYAGYSYLYDIKEVKMTIVQPRLDSISSEVLSIDNLLEWAETIVRPAAELAFAGEGEFKSGTHCKWCKVNGNCRARADENMKALEYEFKDPPLLSVEEIGPILFIAEQLKSWAKDVADYALEQATKGEKIPQWKLVEGRSNRKIPDEIAAMTKLLDTGYEKEKVLTLKGITELEKVLGKKAFKDILSEYVVKPPGNPVLAPETDKRPEINSINTIEKEFENMEMED